MPLVFTPIWLLCIGVRRAKSGPISSAIYLRTVFMQLLGASAAKVSSLLDVLACDVMFYRVAVKRHYDDGAAYHVRKSSRLRNCDRGQRST